MAPGSTQSSLSYGRMEVTPPIHGPSGGALRRRCRCCFLRLEEPRTQMALFVIAQPVAFLLWSWALRLELPAVQEFFSSQASVLNVLLFFVAFSIMVVGLFPLGVIDLAAGFLFGIWMGFPIALATKTFGSVLCFLLSRYTCSEYLRRTLVERYDWLVALSLMMRERQFRTMALLRFSVLPAALKNYGCGSLAVSLGVFSSVTAIALSLESFFLVPIGANIDSLKDMMSRKQTVEEKAGLIVGVILLITLVVIIRRTVRLQIEQIQRDTAHSPSRVFHGAERGAPVGAGGGEIELSPEEMPASNSRMMEHAVF